MPGSLLIVIIDDVPERAQKLKSLIEFMDVPQVQVAEPANWLSRIGDRRLAAVFLSAALGHATLTGVIEDVGEHDPNVPIVMVGSGQNGGDRGE